MCACSCRRPSWVYSAQTGKLTTAYDSSSGDLTPSSQLLCIHMHSLTQILKIKYFKIIFKWIATSKIMNVMKRDFIHYFSLTFSIIVSQSGNLEKRYMQRCLRKGKFCLKMLVKTEWISGNKKPTGRFHKASNAFVIIWNYTAH